MRAIQWLRERQVQAGLVMLAVIVVPAVLTLYTVKVPMPPADTRLNPTPFGYTVSLLIYLLPVVAIHRWFCRRYREGDGIVRRAARNMARRLTGRPADDREFGADYRRTAFRHTLLALIPIGFLLDVVFGLSFLTFENAEATLPIARFPAFSFADGRFHAHIPIEEFIFYALGFMAVLSVYLWCDEHWLQLYNVPDYQLPPTAAGRGLPPFIAQIRLRTPLVVSAALIGAAWLYKKFGPHEFHEGFPSYFSFLVLAALFPSILLFGSTRRFINWRAVSVTVSWVLLTSLLWEATLAAPYGWWGYQERHMMGLFVDAWFALPIEATLLWLAVTFTTVMVYEAFKILFNLQRVCSVGWRTALFGPDSRAWLKEALRPRSTQSPAKRPEPALSGDRR